MPEIGSTLREARMRERIDVSEIEAKTKIRAKYLRALENEEWGLLPGPTFVKSFLRTYGEALGLDGKSLVEQYRVQNEHPSDAQLEPIVPPAQRRSRAGTGPRAPGPSRGYFALVGFILVVIGLLVYGIVSGGSSSHPKTSAGARSAAAHKARTKGSTSTSARTAPAAAPAALVTLSLRATAPVSVCLIGDGGRKLISHT